MKDKNNYMDIIKNNGNILNLLAILISSIGRLNHVKSLDIIMNESYNSEFIINSIKLFDIDSDSIDSNLHILDLLYNRLKDLQQLNLEFNSFDQLTFYKIHCKIKTSKYYVDKEETN
jgi:Leucine-rich repeat (LRR) protein